MTKPGKLAEILDDLRSDNSVRPYQAFNELWLVLVKLANLLPTVGGEHEQIVSLVRALSREESARVVADVGVDRLLALEPPLETLLAEPRERLNERTAATELERLKVRRTGDPKASLLALVELLQRIRDKREHGFKSAHGLRDTEILEASVSILRGLCSATGEPLAQIVSGPESARHDA